MKKIFKNILTLSFIAFSALSFNACQEYEINSQPEAPVNIKIDAMEEYTILAKNPQKIVFNVSSNTPWEITSDQQWCTVTPSMSAASSLVSEIMVTCEPNNTDQQRVATLTISAKDIEKTTTVKLTQVSKEKLVVIPYDEVVPTEGGTISFKLVSNKPWTITPSTMFVENIDKTSGEGNESGEPEVITVTIPENVGAVRKGTITVTTEFDEQSFDITQSGIVIEPENKDEVSNSIEGLSSKTIRLSASEPLQVKVPEEYAEWLDASIDGNQLTLTTKKYNNLFVERVGHVLLSPVRYVPGFEGVPVEVKQPTIMRQEGTVTIDEKKGFATIKSDKVNRFATKFEFSRGRLVWNFENVNITGAGYFDINCDTWHCTSNGAGWIKSHIEASKNSELKCQWDWTESYWKVDDLSTMKTLELSVLDDPSNEGYNVY